jgi:hypothetical protein
VDVILQMPQMIWSWVSVIECWGYVLLIVQSFIR